VKPATNTASRTIDKARWTTWVPFLLAECSDCSALVMDKPEARANHEAWHDGTPGRRPLPSAWSK
jgi:hypothetical protein